MAKLPFLVTGLLLISAPAYAQVIQGVVLEDSTRAPIAGATIELRAIKTGSVLQTVLADSMGEFEIRSDTKGTFTLRTAHPSYRSTETRRVSVDAGELLRVELRMNRAAIPMEPLVVKARTNARLAGFYERASRGGFGRFLMRKDIEERGASRRATDLLRTIPGITIVTAQRRLGAAAVYLITSRSCGSPAIFVDGILMQQSSDGGIDDFLKPDMLQGVEIYTNPATVPLEFTGRGGGACGAVLFWTRPPEESGLGRFTMLKLFGGLGAFVALILLTK